MKKIGILILGFIWILLASSCNRVEIYRCLPIFSMDTTIQVTFYNVKNPETYYKEIKKIYQTYDKVCSDYASNDTENSIYDLNEKRSIVADDTLIELLQEAVRYHEMTKGYFNPFIGRLTHIWKEALEENKLVSSEVIEFELETLKNTSLEIQGNEVSLIGLGNVDLGGIAKGFATQKSKEYLESEGIEGYLIDAGSSNVVFGSKGKEPFKIALEEPYQNKTIRIVEDKYKAIGTSSGKYQNTIVDGVRYHHLLNPFTGYPSNIYDNVNVMCQNSTTCDVFATAFFSMDLETAKAFCNTQEVDIVLFKEDSILYQSSGWKYA